MKARASGRVEIEQRYQPAHTASCVQSSASSPRVRNAFEADDVPAPIEGRCTGDFHVNMWGTSSSEEKLAGDPGNVIEATSIGGRQSDFFTAGKLAPGNFGL